MMRLGKTLVLGLGKSGVASARYLAALLGTGEVESVTAIDAAETPALREVADRLRDLGVEVVLGAGAIEGAYDLCVASPGIAPHQPLMVAARTACARVISEIEFAYSRSVQPWVAVTGTNGKTTTTALVAHLLEAAGMPARAVGNIGTPAIDGVADALEHEIIVAEVSSFQLALTDTFHPRVAVLLNVTPDHIDWHGSLEAYAADKAKIFANLTADDTAVIDVDDPGSRPYAASVAGKGVNVVVVDRAGRTGGGATVADGVLVLDVHGERMPLVAVDDLLIRGAHNAGNALAAAAAVHAMGAPVSAISAGLKSFEPIEHRLEPVRTVRGVEWFNDSKATNPDSVFKALSAFTDRPVVVLLGGRNKGNDFRPLAAEVQRVAKAAVLFGESGEELESAFDGLDVAVVRVPKMQDAVAAAAVIAGDGEAVVLSPACASFDEFSGYEERGRVFKALVDAMADGDDDVDA